MKNILPKIYYIIIFTLVIFSLSYYLYLQNEVNNNLELFTNMSNTITIDLYPKLNKLGNYNNLKFNVISTTIISLIDRQYTDITSKLINITGKKKVSFDVTYNDNISEINKSKINKLFIINNDDQIENINDKMKLLEGNYIFHIEGKKTNNKKTKINYKLNLLKDNFEQPYSLIKSKNDNVEVNSTEYIVSGKQKGGIDQIYIKPTLNQPVKLILKINYKLEDIKCFLTSTYENKIIEPFKLLKIEKIVNGKIVEGFMNYSINESSDDESSDDDESNNTLLDNIYQNLYNIFDNSIIEPFIRKKKKRKKKRKVKYNYYYEYDLDKHYKYDVNFDIIPTINNTFYELKNEDDTQFNKHAIDSYGSDILENQENINEDSNENLYKWIKNRLSKSNNTELYSILANKNYENEIEIGNRRNINYEIDTKNDNPEVKTHNYKIFYNYQPEIQLSDNIVILQFEFSDNDTLKEFYKSMKQIYIGSNLIINKGNINYKKSYSSNKSKYLLFVRSDIFQLPDIDAWLEEHAGISYYEKDKYTIKGFQYENIDTK
tara:strand:- start:3896 stop:5533 length:1638 start_codon:yes stop_codon:yes gene_type:complete